MNFKANLLKKSIIVLVLLLVAGTSFAASGETIVIGGAVPLILDLTVDPNDLADNLDLSSVSATGQTFEIADIDISTNNAVGWELWIVSENGSTLNNADGQTIAYTLEYTGLGTSGTPVATNSTTGVKYGEAAADTSDSATLEITYDQDATYNAGYYSDQLSLLLRAK
ncbi:MAG: hypothetical protein PQJ61_08160 [Spirochaetales bacterium]|uniref:Uncharacterized protein n=1 Tax=Candidatus Thalassospirochaeta sargassi TaxID=3119039 RepID=A0AAJ1ICK7_9SPIO|nr:hypothetical protein [Spirochaetales bacterium]